MRTHQGSPAERNPAPGGGRLADYRVAMRQRQLEAITGALRFAHGISAGDLQSTLGAAALDAWRNLPDVARGCYPARRGDEAATRDAVFETCREIELLVRPDGSAAADFASSRFGAAAKRLAQGPAAGRRFTADISESDLFLVGQAVELELRTRIGHLSPLEDRLLDEFCPTRVDGREWRVLRDRLESALGHLKTVAWQIQPTANYSPWFSDRTKLLYDIYQVVQHERGAWRYSQVLPALKDVPPMEITRLN